MVYVKTAKRKIKNVDPTKTLKITPMPKTKKHRIPYDSWINSQLSIAKFSGGITINGKEYIIDYNNCRTEGKGEDKKYFPDLVEM